MPELPHMVVVCSSRVGDHKGKQLQFSYREEANSHAIRCMLVDPGSLADRLQPYLQ